MENQVADKQRVCTRCGTCCSKGGPTLHDSDLKSVKRDVISPLVLFTIRPGELIRDNINGGLFYTESEIVQIAPRPASSVCLLYDPEERACTIYDERPLQCRAMQCWDTAGIVNLYDRDRISRKALFGHISWLWDLIQTHEAACAYADIRNLAEQRASGDHAAGKQISEMLAYDHSIRQVITDRGGMERNLLDLLFGRPLSKTLKYQFGISVNLA